MKSKSDVLLEYRMSFNKPEKYQMLRLEIEVDKRDVLVNILKMLNDVEEGGETLHNWYKHPLTGKGGKKKCVKVTK